MSVTEMEYHLIKHKIVNKIRSNQKITIDQQKDEVSQRVFAFIRADSAVNNVPTEHKSEFVEANPGKRERLQKFKEFLRSEGVLVSDGYYACYNGVICDHHVMGDLETFGNDVHRCLRHALEQSKHKINYEDLLCIDSTDGDQFLSTFVEPVASAISPRFLLELERSFLQLEARGKQCRALRRFAEQKLLNQDDKASSTLSAHDRDGAILLITGGMGCGKTTQLASLAMCIDKPGWNPPQHHNGGSTEMKSLVISQRPKLPRATIFTHFTQGLSLTGVPPKYTLYGLLFDWVNRLAFITEGMHKFIADSLSRILSALRYRENETGASSGGAMQTSKQEITFFHEFIKICSFFPGIQFALFIDDCDKLKPPILDWLPEVIPQNVQFVFSCDSSSWITRELANRPDSLALTLSGLNFTERAAALRSLFGRYGKILEETSCKNQVSSLVKKRGAELPLYLRLASDELRLHATFEQLDSQIQRLPETIPNLIRHIVARTELECGSRVTRAALGFLYCSQDPLSVSELHDILDRFLSIKGSVLAYDEAGWLALDKLLESRDVNFYKQSETSIYQLLNAHSSNARTERNEKVHLPALAFQILLNNICPLLAAFGEQDESLDPTKRALFEVLSGSCLRFRSREIADIVYETVFKQLNSISASAIAGYRPIPSSRNWLAAKSARYESNVSGDELVTLQEIHWLLATTRTKLNEFIYHLFNAGKINIVCRLLTSGVFLLRQFSEGHGRSLSEDLQGYELKDPELHAKWINALKADSVRGRLQSVKRFVSTHLHTLCSYPFLLPQLAINDPLDPWLRELGFILLGLYKYTMEKEKMLFLVDYESPNSEPNNRFIQPEATYRMDTWTKVHESAPTAIAIDPTGRILACGMDTGNVLLLETKTFRELQTLFGIGSAILSCLFIPLIRYEMSTPSSSFWIIATTKSGSVSLWEIKLDTDVGGRIKIVCGSRFLSLGECHAASVTSCCWHATQRLLATGGLDCYVYLWSLPKTTAELERMQFQSKRSKVPFRCLRTGSGRVSAVAMSASPNEPTGRESKDVIAVGCWDGTVRIHELATLKRVKMLRVSKWAITSLDYSPTDGSLLVTRDVNDRVCLWQTGSYTLLSVVGTMEQFANPTPSKLEISELAPCSLGRVRFSHPFGRYLITSGDCRAGIERIQIWNAKPGATFGPWIKASDHLSTKVTAFTADPMGHLAFVASDNGQITVFCAVTQRVISNHALQPASSRVQCLDCCRYSSSELIVAAGLTNGSVHIFKCASSGDYNYNEHIVSFSSRRCTVSDLVLLSKTSPHSENVPETASAPSGGTLCIRAAKHVVASGGGNGVCCVSFVESILSRSESGSDLVLAGIRSAITAIDVAEKLLVAGTKHRSVSIFELDAEQHKATLLHQIPVAANDWITAIAILPLPELGKRSRAQATLLIGSHDQTVHVHHFQQPNKSRLIQRLDGPGGSVTCLNACGQFFAAGSLDGMVKIWKFTGKESVSEVTSMNLTTGFDSADKLSSGSLRVTNVRLFMEESSQSKQTQSEDEKNKKADNDYDLSLLDLSHDTETSSSSSVSVSMSDDSLEDTIMFEQPETSAVPVSKPQSCLLSLKRPPDNVSPFLMDAPFLRLVVGQTCPPSNQGSKAGPGYFRLRLFGPLLTECRAVLRGHLGAIATGFASGCPANGNDDEMLTSMATAMNELSSQGKDLRLWKVPTTDLGYKMDMLEHHGQVTCLGFLHFGAPSYCISGGADGSIVFRPLPDSDAHTQKMRTSWHISCKIQISSTANPVCISSIHTFTMQKIWCLLVACGRSLFLVTIEPSAIENVQFADLERPSNLVRGVKRYDFKNCIDDVLACNPDASTSFSVTHVGGGVSAVDVLLSQGDEVAFKVSEMSRPNHPAENANLHGENVGSLEVSSSKNPPRVGDRLADGSIIESVTTVPSTCCFLVVKRLEHSVRHLCMYEDGITSSRELTTNMAVTAMCCHANPDDREKLIILAATSDGLVRVYSCTRAWCPDPEKHKAVETCQNTLSHVGMCPIGEHVTSLKPFIAGNKLFVVVGCLSGQVKLHAVM